MYKGLEMGIDILDNRPMEKFAEKETDDHLKSLAIQLFSKVFQIEYLTQHLGG